MFVGPVKDSIKEVNRFLFSIEVGDKTIVGVIIVGIESVIIRLGFTGAGVKASSFPVLLPIISSGIS